MMGTNALIPNSGQKHDTNWICVSSEHCQRRKSESLRTPDVRTRMSRGGDGESSGEDVNRFEAMVSGSMDLVEERY